MGLQNYRDLAGDVLAYRSIANTLVYGNTPAVPGTLVLGLALALLLDTRVWGISFFRTIFYVPTLIPAVAGTMIWLWVFNGEYGVLNYALSHALNPLGSGINAVLGFGSGDAGQAVGLTWLNDPLWSKPALAIMTVWSAGTTMIILLAGLQDVPTSNT